MGYDKKKKNIVLAYHLILKALHVQELDVVMQNWLEC